MGMSKNTTVGGASAARLAVMALLASCSAELPPPQSGGFARRQSDSDLEPVCVDLKVGSSFDTPSAPLAERMLGMQPSVSAQLLALGRNANAILGGSFPDSQGVAQSRLVASVHEDRDTIELLLLGKTDCAVSTVSPSMREAQSGLTSMLLGVELFGFVVSESSPLHNVRLEEIRDVLDGTAVDWRQISSGTGPIRLLLPSDTATCERAMRVVAPGRRLTVTAQGVDSTTAAFEAVVRDPSAIALVHLAAQPAGANVRVLSIDGTLPSVAAFARGSYPAGVPLWLVTRGVPGGAAAEIRDGVSSGELVLADQRVCVH